MVINRLLWVLSLSLLLQVGARAQEDPTADDSVAPPTQTTPAIDPRTPEEIAKAQKEAEEAVEQACGACGAGLGILIAVGVAVLALNIALLIWVARDAKNRGMDSAVLWMMLVMFTGLIGLIIYLCSRPQGQLAQCASCNNKRLAASAKCPHCQNP